MRRYITQISQLSIKFVFVIFRTADLQAKRERMPTVDRTPEQPPPLLVALVGPRKVGKTTLLRALVRHFTRTKISTPVGPITIVAGRFNVFVFMYFAYFN